jgi:hypothetical protein
VTNLRGQSFAADPQRQADYNDFLRRFQQDPNSISAEEAARRYRELLSHASPDLATEAHHLAFGQLPSADRHVLAEHFMEAQQDPKRPFDGYTARDASQAADPRDLGRMALQAQRQDPGLLDQLLGPNSPLNSPLGRMVLSTAVAYLASRIFGGQQRQDSAQAPAGDLGDLISRVLGGAQQPAGAGTGGGLGDLLGALTRGGGGQPAGSGLPGGLGDILGALAQGGGPSAGQAPVDSGPPSGEQDSASPDTAASDEAARRSHRKA